MNFEELNEEIAFQAILKSPNMVAEWLDWSIEEVREHFNEINERVNKGNPEQIQYFKERAFRKEAV